MKTMKINKKQLRGMVGVIAGSEGSEVFKNTVMGYIDGEIPIFIKTNLTQKQWDKFVSGELSREELEEAI